MIMAACGLVEAHEGLATEAFNLYISPAGPEWEQLAGGEDCEICDSVGMELPPVAVQLPTPAVCVAGQTQYFSMFWIVNRMGC